MYGCIDRVARNSLRSSKIALFENLEQYVQENSGGFSDLEFQNFRLIFLYYFLVCSLVFVVACVVHLVNFTKIKTKIIVAFRR